mmetsp:Transcript_40863/g.129839  ORF Transcript_40863/g.129839 Transcript_40863/m.129839 type:complete len:256 (-) Transcript_40863:309-1076(-)
MPAVLHRPTLRRAVARREVRVPRGLQPARGVPPHTRRRRHVQGLLGQGEGAAAAGDALAQVVQDHGVQVHAAQVLVRPEDLLRVLGHGEPHEEAVAGAVGVHDPEVRRQPAEQPGVPEVAALVLLRAREVRAHVHQDDPDDVVGPLDVAQQGALDVEEDEAAEDRKDDTAEERLAFQLLWRLVDVENHVVNEHRVERQGVLDDKTGVEGQHVVQAASIEEHKDAKHYGHKDIEACLDGGQHQADLRRKVGHGEIA